MTKKKLTHIPAADLVQLNALHAAATLAKEQLEHATTRHKLLEALVDAAKLRRELSRLSQEASETKASEQSAGQVQAALTEKNAAAERWDALVADLRRRYALDPGQGIDPISGELMQDKYMSAQ